MSHKIKDELRELNLRAIADNIEFRLEQALKHSMSHLEFLRCLLEDERNRRHKKAFLTKLKASKLNPGKTLENFDFDFQPTLNKSLVMELSRCEFIERKGKILLVGVSGTGKTHCSNGIGLKAIEKGFRVARYKSIELVDELLKARKNGNIQALIRKIKKTDLVIIDEFALRKYPEGGSAELQGLLDELDEHCAVAITSNRDFKDWEPFFDDKTIASAFVDRAVHDGTIVRIAEGRSYRTRNYERKGETDN